MATTPPTITPFTGAVPQRGDRTTFGARVDVFVTWLIACVAQFAAVAANVYANAQEAFTSASTATSAATTAAATANATLWASGATVQQYAAVISPADGRTYRRTAATGAGTTDPSLDAANYVALSAQPSTYALVAAATVGASVANIDFLNVFTAAYDNYRIEILGVKPSANALMAIQLASGGSTVISTGSYTFLIAGGSTGADAIQTFVQFRNSTSPSSLNASVASPGFTVEVRNVNSTTAPKGVGVRGMFYNNSATPAYEAVVGEAYMTSTVACTGFRLSWAGQVANFTAGTIRVYGIKNS